MNDLVVDGFGSFWVDMIWFWVVLDRFGWLWLVLGLFWVVHLLVSMAAWVSEHLLQLALLFYDFTSHDSVLSATKSGSVSKSIIEKGVR